MPGRVLARADQAPEAARRLTQGLDAFDARAGAIPVVGASTGQAAAHHPRDRVGSRRRVTR